VIGFLVDDVIGSTKIPLRQLQTSFPMMAGASAKYLYGITKERLLVFDAKKILQDERLHPPKE
jgi:chemotaxis signal transduction protein